MCVSRIVIAIKSNKFSTKDLGGIILSLELIFRKIKVRVSSDGIRKYFAGTFFAWKFLRVQYSCF